MNNDKCSSCGDLGFVPEPYNNADGERHWREAPCPECGDKDSDNDNFWWGFLAGLWLGVCAGVIGLGWIAINYMEMG